MSTDANDNGASDGERLDAAETGDLVPGRNDLTPDSCELAAGPPPKQAIPGATKPRKPGTFDSSRAKQARARVGGGGKGKDQRKQSKLEKLAWKVIERALENPDTPEYVLRQYAELALKYERGAPVSMKELGTLPPADASPAVSEGILESFRRLAGPGHVAGREQSRAQVATEVDVEAALRAFEPKQDAPQPLQDASAAHAPPMPADVPTAAPVAARDVPAPRRSGRHARSAPPVPTTAPARSLGELVWRPVPGSGGSSSGGGGDDGGTGGRCC